MFSFVESVRKANDIEGLLQLADRSLSERVSRMLIPNVQIRPVKREEIKFVTDYLTKYKADKPSCIFGTLRCRSVVLRKRYKYFTKTNSNYVIYVIVIRTHQTRPLIIIVFLDVIFISLFPI